MKSLLLGFIEDKDFYSAHQLLLSHSQKLERKGNYDQSLLFLFNGTKSLNDAKAPSATLIDVISKFMDIVKTHHLDSHKKELLEFLQILTCFFEPSESLSLFIREFSISMIKCGVEGLDVVTVMIENSFDVQEIIHVALKECMHDTTVFIELGNCDFDGDNVLVISLNLIKNKCFASNEAFYNSVSNHLQLKPQKVDGLFIWEELSPESRALNFVSHLSFLLRHKNPPREIFVELQLRYANLLKSESTKALLNSIKESAWPSKPAQPAPINPLASLLQSMMS